MYIRKFRTLNMENPLGIDVNPYFSWIMESEKKNVVQTAFQLVITDEKGKLVWDTGIRKSDISAFVTYEGETLESCTRYLVKVKVWNNYEEMAEAKGTFETAFLRTSDWKAEWAESQFRRKKGKKDLADNIRRRCFARNFCSQEKSRRPERMLPVMGYTDLA